MEELIQAKKHFSKLGWIYLIGTVVIYIAQLVVYLVVEKLQPQWLDNGNITIFMNAMSMYLIGFPVLFLLLKKNVPAIKIEKHKLSVGKFLLASVMCIGLAYALNLFGVLTTFVIGHFTGNVVENQIMTVMDSVHPLTIFIYMVICAPIGEEFFFRKMIVDRTARYGQGVAVVVSGLMFGLFHGNFNQFIYAAGIGMFLAFLYVKTGDLKITIFIHMIFNFLGGFVSNQLIHLIDLDKSMEIIYSGDTQALMAYLMDNIVGWGLYMLFVCFVYGMLIAGVVLIIVFLVKKKFVLNQGEIYMPKELRFNMVFANAGMLLFIVLWTARIIRQLFA